MGFASDGDEDDAAAAMGLVMEQAPWTLPAWHMDPDSLAAHAKSMLHADFASAATAAMKHSDPPTNPAMRSC